MKYPPDTLLALIEGMFAGKNSGVKGASIGQAIMQATRPRVMLAPLQLGLCVQLHHHIASRFLIDSLHHHGLCCSYQDVHQFERNATHSHGTDIPNLTRQNLSNIIVADNVDRTIRTLDGHGTCHGMGMIVAVTPGTTSNHQGSCDVTRCVNCRKGANTVPHGRTSLDGGSDLPDVCQHQGP